ncbi:MAG TPA: hypothetical protein VLE95_02020 [Chlamydiales bacterium]|nr:hypothetical protein [Chlamydiales bacterium]
MRKIFWFFLGLSALGATENEGNYEHYFRENKVVVFHYLKPGQASARLEFLGQLPDDNLIQENKNRFSQTTRMTAEGVPYQVFSLEISLPSDTPSPSLCEGCKKQQMKFAEDQTTLLPVYLTYGEGRDFMSEQRPQQISIASCKAFLQNKKCLIVVGTALAEHAGVATRSHFASEIGLEKGKTVDSFVHRFLLKPESILQQYIERTEKGLFGEPTPLIRDLALLSTRLDAPIFTCNFDQLIQKTGVSVVNILEGKTTSVEEILQNVDVILTIGLSRDPERVLAYFKNTNPRGAIVAVDLKQPCYLGDEDFLLSMDLREAIPELLKD